MAAIAHIKMTLNVADVCLSVRLGWPAVVLDAYSAHCGAAAVLPAMFIHVQVHVPERVARMICKLNIQRIRIAFVYLYVFVRS